MVPVVLAGGLVPPPDDVVVVSVDGEVVVDDVVGTVLEPDVVDVVEVVLDPLPPAVEELDPSGGPEAVLVPVVEVTEPEVVVAVVEVVEAGEVVVVASGLAGRPLLLIVVSISCWTLSTSAATAAGVPLTPRDGSAFSCLSSMSSSRTSCFDGWDLSVTTIWSAIAVVTQAGQLSLSAPATLIGAIVLLWPTISTTWKETATVVQLLQSARP